MTLGLAIILAAGAIPAKPAFAASTLTVDCGTTIRGVTHCASVSLYGVTESKPGDIAQFVEPLKPNILTNPALVGSKNQQPIGAAIQVAGRLTNTTGKVMIRLVNLIK
jgi:hypothetical protein